MQGNQNNFDLIRLFAAASVAILHAEEHLGLNTGWTALLRALPGVPIFFFISGFLIYQSYENCIGLRQFLCNRALRIYPALYGCFLASLALITLAGVVGPEQLLTVPVLKWTLAQLSFAQFYNPQFLRGFGVGVLNGSLWTISVELQFYLLTPVLHWVTRGRKWAWPAIAVAFAFANLLLHLINLNETPGKVFNVSFAPWFYMFVTGAWLSTRPDLVQWISNSKLWIVAGGLVATSAITYEMGLPVGSNGINPVMFLALSALVIKLAFTRPELAGRLLRRHDLSYGLYIYHMPVVNAIIFFQLQSTVAGLVIALLATCLLAAVSWWLLERPALSLKRVALRR